MNLRKGLRRERAKGERSKDDDHQDGDDRASRCHQPVTVQSEHQPVKKTSFEILYRMKLRVDLKRTFQD